MGPREPIDIKLPAGTRYYDVGSDMMLDIRTGHVPKMNFAGGDWVNFETWFNYKARELAPLLNTSDSLQSASGMLALALLRDAYNSVAEAEAGKPAKANG